MTPEQLALLKAARQPSPTSTSPCRRRSRRPCSFSSTLGPQSLLRLQARPGRRHHGSLRADFPERLAAEGRLLGHRAELPRGVLRGPIWRGNIFVQRSSSRAELHVATATTRTRTRQLRDVAKYLRWLQEADKTVHVGHARRWPCSGTGPASTRTSFFDLRRTEEQTRMFKSGLQNEPVVLPSEHADADELEDAGGAAAELRRQRLAALRAGREPVREG